MCNPLTSAACVAQIAAGSLGNIVPGGGVVPGGAIGGLAGGAAKAAAGGAADAAAGGLAGAIQNGIGTIAKDMVAWWISLPSPDLAADPVPRVLAGWLYPFTISVAIVAVITAGARMALTRKSAPLVDVGSGLLTVAVTAAAGTLLPTLLLRAGDAYSNAVLSAATGGQFASRFTALLAFASVTGPGATAILLVIGMIALVLAAVQAVLLLFRQVAVVILAGVLPLAAAGTLTPLTRPWFRRTTGWMLALIFYKPAAASVYASGFLLVGRGRTAQDVLGGVAVLVLSLVALPVLVKFFSWAPGQLEGSGGGGVLSSVIGGAAAIGALRGFGGGESAADQARAMSMAAPAGAGGGPPRSAGEAGGGPGGGPGGSGGTGPGGSGPGGTSGTGPGGSGPGAGAGAGPGPAGAAAGAAAGAGPGPAPRGGGWRGRGQGRVRGRAGLRRRVGCRVRGGRRGRGPGRGDRPGRAGGPRRGDQPRRRRRAAR